MFLKSRNHIVTASAIVVLCLTMPAKSEALFPVECGEEHGYINDEGKLVIPGRFEEARSFSEGLAAVRQDDLWGFVNTKGELAIKPQFKEVGDFADGLAPIARKKGLLGKAFGFVDTSGRVAIDYEYDEVGMFCDGLARAKKDGKWGYIGKDGQWKIKPEFDVASDSATGWRAFSRAEPGADDSATSTRTTG